MSSSHFNDEDVIEATPPKKTKKMKGKSKKTIAVKHSLDDYIINIPHLFAPEDKLTNSSGSTEFNKPYVYYSVEEIMKLPKNNLLNNYIHTVGILKVSSDYGIFLTNYISQESDLVVPLNFKYVKSIPKEDEMVSIYGCLENDIFLVRFYRIELKAVVDKYIQNLKFIRNFIPTKYLN